MVSMQATKKYLLNEIKLILNISESYYYSLMWEYNNTDWNSPLAISLLEDYIIRVRMHVNQEY